MWKRKITAKTSAWNQANSVDWFYNLDGNPHGEYLAMLKLYIYGSEPFWKVTIMSRSFGWITWKDSCHDIDVVKLKCLIRLHEEGHSVKL